MAVDLFLWSFGCSCAVIFPFWPLMYFFSYFALIIQQYLYTNRIRSTSTTCTTQVPLLYNMLVQVDFALRNIIQHFINHFYVHMIHRYTSHFDVFLSSLISHVRTSTYDVYAVLNANPPFSKLFPHRYKKTTAIILILYVDMDLWARLISSFVLPAERNDSLDHGWPRYSCFFRVLLVI